MKIEIDVEKTLKWSQRNRYWILVGFLGFILWRIASFVWYQPDNAWTQGQLIVTTIGGIGAAVGFIISLIIASETRY